MAPGLIRRTAARKIAMRDNGPGGGVACRGKERRRDRTALAPRAYFAIVDGPAQEQRFRAGLGAIAEAAAVFETDLAS